MTREFTQLRNTLHDGRAYYCLFGIIWATSARLQWLWLCLEGFLGSGSLYKPNLWEPSGASGTTTTIVISR